MNIVIFMEGGVIQDIIADAEARVIVVDRDVEGLDEKDIKTVLGNEAYVYSGLRKVNIDPKTVQMVLIDLEEQQEQEE